MSHQNILSTEFKLSQEHSKNIIQLIDDGNTIPFIARYRKEMTGECDDQVLREFADRLAYLRKLDERKEVVINSITEQGFMTDEIAAALKNAKTLTEVEDIYRPYKPKRKTRATVAIAKGLQPLADIIWAQDNALTSNILETAKNYITEEVKTTEDAINGAKDILAEKISDTAELRKLLREQLFEHGTIATALIKDEKKEKAAKSKKDKDDSKYDDVVDSVQHKDKTKDKKERILTYEMYDNYSEPVKKIVAHRILAINRGEKEDCIKCDININEELPINTIDGMFLKNPEAHTTYLVKESGEDAYKRLIKPSVENEVRAELFEKAAEQAIKMFEVNLRPLLLQPPIKNKITLGLDPAYRTGCKIAVCDGLGNVLDRAIVYFTMPHNKVDESKKIIKGLCEKHKVEIIAIGNGTASKESEIFIADFIKEFPQLGLSYMVVNEAGASVYSASKLAAKEFPDFDVAHRSAASIARRLQDPLAELIKIDPKSIGVGQYQHDMPPARLDGVLQGVVEDCVNSVGVDLNSASPSLLSHVSGLSMSAAENITAYRQKIGGFKSREELRKVPKMGPKTYEQCAGFLRILEGENILDNTAVHPESYEAAEKLLKLFELDNKAVKEGKLGELEKAVEAYGKEKAAAVAGIGVPTLEDIIKEIIKPGRDLRDELPPPMLRTDVMDMNDLKEGMELVGTVRNVIDFGVFVDIGVHQDGLVHISQITDAFIKHPSEVLSVGEVVKVRVLGVEKEKNRIALTMKGFDSEAAKKARAMQAQRNEQRQNDRNFNRFNKEQDKRSANNNFNKNNNSNNTALKPQVQKEKSVSDALAELMNKYGRK
ncbi:MAG: RNA-binding transcriptional accessory protein [Firmicutes bacterium]|nr:RNA-binding transcriptional accessory protein [Bacillota bacterium]